MKAEKTKPIKIRQSTKAKLTQKMIDWQYRNRRTIDFPEALELLSQFEIPDPPPEPITEMKVRFQTYHQPDQPDA